MTILSAVMTTNILKSIKTFTKDAMRALVAQAEDNDNVSTIYVSDKNKNSIVPLT